VGVLALRSYLPTVYLTLPPLLWAAVRFQLQGAATALGLITLLSALFTMIGEGEFAGHPDLLHEKIVMLQTFLGVAAVSALIVAALSRQYRQALLNLQTINTELEARVAERTATLRASETQLRQLAAVLSEADQRKNEFLATLAHELRNPLAPLHNGLELIKLAGDNGVTVARARSLMERQLVQLVRLVDDLMDVSRITRGMIELKQTPVPLAAIIDSALETSRPLIEQMGHKLTVTLPAQPVVVNADLTRLAQVFVNLLNNSAKYMEQGGNIELSAVHQGSDVIVSVRDTGIGIPADELTRIFEMFSQVERSLEKRQGGLGIGLTLVKQLVGLHGGSIEARSEGPGLGAEFVVRLPVVIEATVPESPEHTAAAAPTPARRILIVDDNRDAADSLASILQNLGHDTHTAYDGQTGLDRAVQVRPDVVLLDIGLPVLNGYEVCRRLREQPWSRPPIVIAVTGWGQDEDRRRSREAGFDRHLIKPVDVGALLKLLDELQMPKAG
jgi:signal transduction histidine kinase/ActR/RegA family two-component response regulator